MKIKTRIFWTLLGMSLLVALVGALAVDRQRASVKTAAVQEAENVAQALGFLLISDTNQFSTNAQAIITKLHETEGRDVFLTDVKQTILADANPSEIGENFTADPNDEVGATIKDGQVRTFVEMDKYHPAGIKQIVAPVKDKSGQIIGAVVLEYTPLYNELMNLTKVTMREVTLAAIGSVLIALLIAFYMGRSIVLPLQQLTKVATEFAAGRTDLPLPPPRADAIGVLASAFGNMVQRRQQAEDALRQARDELENRVAERMAELAETNKMLHGKTAFLEAQVNSSIDGILVVDEQGKNLLQNQRMVDLWKMPKHIADEIGDENRLRWVVNLVKNSEQFLEKIGYLYSHPNEISRDEIELKDGRIFDRYSSPVTDDDGKYYGRIWTFRDITERKRMEESLRAAHTQLEELLAHSPAVIYRLKLEGQNIVPLMSSGNITNLLGFAPAETLSYEWWLGQLHPDDHAAALASVPETLKQGTSRTEYRLRHKDGSYRWVDDNRRLLCDASGQPMELIGVWTDITERKRIEGHLFQSQKMETVGKLAGGIAHEFNSIMTAIIGQSELLLTDLPPENALVKNATEIRKAAERAATLTRQLLAYGRKQFLQLEILDLNTVLAGMETMLHHLMGKNVDVRVAPAASPATVNADAGQIEQVIMNIAMNAADAMPNGGKLTLETANVVLDAEYVSRFPELEAGDYVMLVITDTGAGMNENVKARVFEPFFTTKDVGKGTGLGLATCHGIVKQSGGHIAVYSEPGRGATFKIYLPHAEPPKQAQVPRRDSAELPRGTETILLVEDDPSLREMAGSLLQRLGYTVLMAANGVEALTLAHQQNTGYIDLLFTDVVMPHMSGKELSDRIRSLFPKTKILFTSAYTESAIVHQGALNPGVELLQKPFTPSALAHKVREMLKT